MTSWELREMRPDDRNYVLSSWLQSYAELGRRRRVWNRETRTVTDPGGEFQGMMRAVYFRLYEPVVERLVDVSVIAVATLPEAPDTVLGWMAIDGDVLHYLHVKPRWRKLGVARWLLGHIGEQEAVYTHEPTPAVGARLIPASWSFDPMRRFERKAA